MSLNKILCAKNVLCAVWAFLFVLSQIAHADTKTDLLKKAQQMDKDLRAVDWFAEEYLRKAQKAKLEGEAGDVEFFMGKAESSLKKSHSMRKRAVKSWSHLQAEEHIDEIWLRAVRIAKIRAAVLQAELDVVHEKLTLSDEKHGELEQAYWDMLDEMSNQWYLIASYYSEIEMLSQQVIALQNAMLFLSPILFLDDEELRRHWPVLKPFFEHDIALHEDLIQLLLKLPDEDKAAFYSAELQRLQQRFDEIAD